MTLEILSKHHALYLLKNTVSSSLNKKDNTRYLHPSVIEILYGNYLLIKNIFNHVKQLLDIDYFGLTLISPTNELMTLSTHPNIEFNLIHSKLWVFDKTFSNENTTKNNNLFWWDDDLSYTNQQEKIKRIKLANNRFSLGLSLRYKINNYCLFYNFASLNEQSNLKSIYLTNSAKLTMIGNYMYHRLVETATDYESDHAYLLPNLGIAKPTIYKTKTNRLITLIPVANEFSEF